MRSGELTIQWN